MKRFFASMMLLLAFGLMLTVKAETAPDVKTYATDESGLFSLRCEYYKSTDYYEIILQYVDYSAYEIWDPELEINIPNPDVKNLVFPAKVHAKFEKYNGVDDLEDDFEYVLSEQTLDEYQAARVVETITFEEGITAIPDYFYQMTTKEVMTDTWEDYAANEASVLREIKFPASVMTIGDQAFVGHINLEKITFGAGLTSIGDEAFKAVREYSMGGGMMEDPVEDVWHGALTELVLPETLSDIGDEAFKGQSQLKSLVLPVNLMTIGEDAFDHTGIETLTADVPMLSLSGTSPFASCPIKKLIIPCDGTPEAFVAMVPSHLMHGVTSRFDVEFVPKPGIGEQCESYLFYESCFENSGVQSINFLSEVVESVMYPSFVAYKRAFYNTNWFKSLLLGSMPCGGYVYIYEEAFKLSGLETLTLNNRVKEIGKDAFSNTRIKSVVLPQFVDPLKSEDGFTEIGEGAFYNCQQLESAKIEGAVSIMGNENWLANDIFNRCYKLSSLEIPASVTHIGSNAFTETAIEEFVGSENVVEIYPETFANCEELEKVDLSATKIERINESLFENTPKLSEIKFPEGLLLIDQYAFKQSGLKELAVPAKSNALAFTEMPNLEKISFTSDKIETLIDEVITDCPKLKEIDFGFAKTLDKEFVKNCPLYTDVVITPNIKIINKEAFASIKDQIKSVTFNAKGMDDIADKADAPFTGMKFALNFGKDVDLPKYVFANVRITDSPDLSGVVGYVPEAFEGAVVDTLNWHYASSFMSPFKNARIEKLAFSDIKTVKKELFKNHEIDVVDLRGIETIEESAFEDSHLKNVANSRTLVIPASVKTIGKRAFANNLVDNVILEKGEGLTIGEEAFSSDHYYTLTTRYDKDNIPVLGEKAFEVFGSPIDVVYAGSCEDVEAYKAADGWKDVDALKWDGASVYKYSVEIVGETTKRPIEYYYESIYLNGKTLTGVNFIGCDNKAKLEFTSPCPDITFEHWNDPEAKDPKNYELTLTSDTVIKIYVKETSEKIELAFRDEDYSDKAKLYFQYNLSEWVEQSEVNRNACDYSHPDSIKVVIDDLGKCEFAGWYTYDAEKDAWTQYEYEAYDPKTETWIPVKAIAEQIPCPEKAIKLYAFVRPRQYYIECSVSMEDMMYFDHFELNGVDKGTSLVEYIPYGDKVELKAVGLSGAGYRYVLDYWENQNDFDIVSYDNPYAFTMPTEDLRFTARMKSASSYTVTVKSSDEALGKVTMTVDPADMDGEKIWEQAAIELQADAETGEHGRFKEWNDGELSEHRVVYATKNFEYVAIFEKDSFNIAVNAEGIAPEAVEITGAGTYGWNDDVELKFTLKDEHYNFDAWTWEDKYSSEEVLKFKATEHLNVQARFSAKTYTITVLAEPAEGGKVTVEDTPVYGTLVKLKAEANEGYEFAGWKDDVEAPALRPVEVLGDATYTALFKKKGPGTGVDNVQGDKVQCTKVLREGTIYIIRDGKIFDVTGRRMK